jgi:hypothetical protein
LLAERLISDSEPSDRQTERATGGANSRLVGVEVIFRPRSENRAAPNALQGRRPMQGAAENTQLDRNELGAPLVAAGLGPAAVHALIWLLALNGLRSPKPPARTPRPSAWSEATGPW